MEQISINLLTTGETPVCHVSQYDIGRTIRFNLISDSTGEAYTLDGSETINIRIRKPDGTETTEDIENTSDAYVDFTTSEDTCDQSGVNICELSISKAGAKIGTKNFRMKVEADAYDGEGVIVESASGAIATFETNIIENLVECKCNIDAIQDLHGYTKPWAGGAGKNKLKPTSGTQTINGITFTVSDGVVTTSGTWSVNTTFLLSSAVFLPAGTYILNGCPAGGSYSKYVLRIENAQAQRLALDTGSGETFTLAEGQEVYCRIYIYSSDGIGKTFRPMVRLSSISDATYEPYENICPIYGHSEATIIRTGVNLWDEDWELGALQWANGQPTAASDRIRSKNYNPIKAQTQYYMRTDTSITSGVPIVFYYDKDKNLISYSESTIRNTIIETPANTAYFKLCILQTTSYTSGISLNFPASDRDYHPYAGEAVTIPFGQEIFGGVLDASSGTLEIKYGIVDLSTLTWVYASGAKRWEAQKLDMYAYPARSGDVIFEKYETDTTATAGSEGKGFISQKVIYISSTDDANSPTGDCVYPLANPTEISLTPQQIETLDDQETNIFCDTGNISVKYYKKA